eukprot:UN28278
MEADLFKYSSNRDLCDGVGRNICARYTWYIHISFPIILNFKASAKPIDLTPAAIFLDGNLIDSGGRGVVQDFDIPIQSAGRHRIEVFGYEECCSGNHESQYHGWTLTMRMKWKGFFDKKGRSNGGSLLGKDKKGSFGKVPGEVVLQDFPPYIDDENTPSPSDDRTTEIASTTEEAADTTTQRSREFAGASAVANKLLEESDHSSSDLELDSTTSEGELEEGELPPPEPNLIDLTT